MKKIFLFSTILFATAMILPQLARAEESFRPPMPPVKILRPGAPIIVASTTASTTMRDRILGDYERQRQNVQNNQNLRNTKLEDRREKLATSTKHDDDDATSTPKRDAPRGQIIRFEIGHVGKSLHVALTNLKQVRSRINTAITTATTKGRDMTKAKADLAIADAKIALAAKAVADFDALASSTRMQLDNTSDASNAVFPNLSAPRQALVAAQKALKEAKDALHLVIRDIAKALGIGLSDNASSTPPQTSSTTPPQASSTTP